MAEARAYDIVIVGAGAAGSVLARRLAGPGDRSVALLEAGPDLRSDAPTELRDGWCLPEIPDWGYRSEPDAVGETQRVRRGRLVGGTSWLTRFAVRGAAADFDAWGAAGNEGWTFEEVLPVFRRIEADAEFGDERWHGDVGPVPITRYPELEPALIHAAAIDALVALGFPQIVDHNAPSAVGVSRMPFSARGGARVTAADAFLPADLALPKLMVKADAPVATIIVEAGRARGVRLFDGSEIDADRVILAAGVYGSPTLLLRSGIGPASHLRDLGIKVLVDLPGVGANLADHPSIALDPGWRGTGASGPQLHTIATFHSSRAHEDVPDLVLWMADPDGEDATFEIEALLMKPRSRGRVRLRSSDPTAAPSITLPGLTEPDDVDRLVEAFGVALELANQGAIRRLAEGRPPSDPGGQEARRRAVIEGYHSIPHTVGTCRMGPSADEGGVVDALGRVHGIDGLSVIDASIIPDATSGFPHIVTIMLADLLAERLLGSGL